MIRASCDFLSKYGYWVKPLSTSGYNEKGVPDVIAVRNGDNPKLNMNLAFAKSEGKLYVECETGKKHLYGRLDKWLAKTIIEKIDHLPLKKEKNSKSVIFDSEIIFVLSERLFESYVKLHRDKHTELMRRAGLLRHDMFRIYNIKSILPLEYE